MAFFCGKEEQKNGRTEKQDGRKPVISLLASMSLPMMLSMLVQSLYNIVDSMYVSWMGTEALTAVSLAYPLQNIVMAVSVGIGVGISSALSISLGEKNQEKANETATIGMALTLVHCVIFVLFGLAVTRPFLQLFTSSPQVLEDACDYTYIVLCVSSGSLLQISLEKIYQGIGAMKTTMILLATGCIINIILDPILIFGLLGFPAMGVQGAAIATVIGQIGAFLLYIVVYLHRNPGVTIHPRYLKLNWPLIRRIYSVGIPSSLMLMMPSLLVSALNGILAAFSEVYVAVLGVYFKLQTFIYMPANGMVQGMRPIIGYNYGAGQYGRVRQTIRYCLMGAAVLMLIGTVRLLRFREAFCSCSRRMRNCLRRGDCAAGDFPWFSGIHSGRSVFRRVRGVGKGRRVSRDFPAAAAGDHGSAGICAVPCAGRCGDLDCLSGIGTDRICRCTDSAETIPERRIFPVPELSTSNTVSGQIFIF